MEGFSDKEVEVAKAHCQEVFLQQAFHENWLLASLLRQMRHGYSMRQHSSFLNAINALDKGEVDACFRRFIQPACAITFVEVEDGAAC